MKKYRIYLEGSEDYDLFAGELPPKDEYDLTERQITKENWNALIGVLNENDFMELPKELSGDDTSGGFTYYIQVETADDVHKSGGHMAGHGDDDTNQRFNAIYRELNDIIYPHPQNYYVE